MRRGGSFRKGKLHPRWKGGIRTKQYYCKECNNRISVSAGLYGGGFCRSCCKKGDRNPLYGKKQWNDGLRGIYHFSEKARKNMSIAHQGHTGWNKGMKGYTNKGSFEKGCISYMKNKHHTEETKLKMRGRKLSKEQREKRSGANSPNWQGGISPLNRAIRGLFEYKEWRSAIYQRDSWTCVECGQVGGKNLNAHHIKPFIVLYKEFLQEYDQFSPFEDQHTLLRLATKWQPFWDISNGITLCKKCHQLTKKGSKFGLQAHMRHCNK